MAVAEAETAFTVSPRPGPLGADVAGIDFASPFSAAEVAALHAALAAHKVLFFHDQFITSEQQLARGRELAELEIHPFAREEFGRAIFADPVHPELVVVESTPERPTVAEQWHSDTTFRECPSLGSILRLTHKPASGGRTLWADMAAAYAGLDEATRARIDGLTAEHDWANFRRTLVANGTDAETIAALVAAHPPAEHPVVRTHPVTGERCLFVNVAFTSRIKGLPEDESEALLRRLYAQAENPDWQVAQDWQPGDIVIWDNRSTQHSVEGNVVGHRRLERVTLVGDRPF